VCSIIAPVVGRVEPSETEQLRGGLALAPEKIIKLSNWHIIKLPPPAFNIPFPFFDLN